jgi:oxygen-independent coproporphyrinogen-3 oxidase
MMHGVMPILDDPGGAAAAGCGLYVHIPFCSSKCGYCDFYSIALQDRATAPLIDRISCELGKRLSDNSRKVRTVFCGGGTPTVLPGEQLSALLRSLAATVSIHELTEFTVEANPATVDDEKAGLLVAGGVSRVSMGAQSFRREELAVLERLHSPDDIAPSVGVLRRNGVRQINLDLIFGIPGQTLDSWSESLRRAVALEPDHIACYGLTYEPGTRLTAMRRRGRITPLEENLEADMYLHAIDTLLAAGYEQYEISNFARPGCRCEHNLIYWRNGPYIGVGPSAVGCVGARRYKNVANVEAYIRMMDARGHAEAESEIIDTPTLVTEMIMMQLRLVEGLSIDAFRRRTGIDPVTRFGGTLSGLVDLGHLVVSDTHIALTRAGRLISDAIVTELVCASGNLRRKLPVRSGCGLS